MTDSVIVVVVGPKPALAETYY